MTLGLERLAVIMATAMLGGCASFDGTPHPVMPTEIAVKLAQAGPFDLASAASVAMAGRPPGGGTLGDYRNAFLAVQMAAIDAQYFRFRRDLTAQAKGANFALDLGILGLTGGGAIAGERAANILSAGGAGLTGAKASLNKEVYFEKTLPALVASMDARRLTLKVAILRKMRQSTDAYSLAEAITDISTFQLSASIDAAIEQITGDANTAKETATRSYTNLVATCAAPEPAAIAVSIGIKGSWMRSIRPSTSRCWISSPVRWTSRRGAISWRRRMRSSARSGRGRARWRMRRRCRPRCPPRRGARCNDPQRQIRRLLFAGGAARHAEPV